MEMEGKEKEAKHKNRFKGLFSKEKKVSPEGDVDDFLRSPSDKLYFQAPVPTPPATSSQDLDTFLHRPSDKLLFAATPNSNSTHPPPLTRIDTSSARRWPSAAEIQSSQRPRGRSASPKRSKKGLVVKFTDEQPEVIGEGGDEAELPTISLRQRAQSHPPGRARSREPPARNDITPNVQAQETAEGPGNLETLQPGFLRRAPTGFESISDSQSGPPQRAPSLAQENFDTGFTHKGSLDVQSHDRKSFAARVRAERRSGEGLALLHASPNTSTYTSDLSLMDDSPDTSAVNSKPAADSPERIGTEDNNEKSTIAEKPMNESLMKLELPDYSPINLSNHLSALSIEAVQNTSLRQPSPSSVRRSSPALSIPPQPSPGPLPTSQGTQDTLSASANGNTIPIARTSPLNVYGAAVAVGDDALQDFSTRVTHLFNIFLLSAESKKPISKCSLEEFIRAALWWFLKGRLQLESTIRDRPTALEAQQTNFLIQQQAYADLAKSFWIIEIITSQYPELSSQQKDPSVIDTLETRKAILSSLRKLAISMKRNNFLPPEEATLPQGFDTSIWIQDDGNRSLLSSQKQAVLPNLNDYFPLGDTNRSFHYGRAFIAAVLIEDADSHSQEYRSPAMISIIRGHTQTALTAVIASQDGMLKVCVQADKSLGPTWDTLAWNSKSNILDIRLPRGFLLRLQCNYQDFRTLRGIYDYQKKTHGGMVRQQDEELIFETFLKTFQYFSQESASTFPKEALSDCRLRLFEKTVVEKAASGARSMHRGFRIGLVTSPTTKNLRGINQELLPTLPIQFGFLRSDGGLPTLLLKIDNEESKYRLAFTFENVNERTQLHARVTGVSLGDKEAVMMESEVKEFSVAGLGPAEPKDILKQLEWQSIRIINEEQDDPHSPKTVRSSNLRVVTDFGGGSVTDRVNIGPGELKVRLDVNNPNELKVLRQPQQDMTVSVSESQVSKELPHELTELLTTIATSETIRTYTFPSLQELHLFQAALIGFTVLYDGMATSFNISRRRMVVPIYKKWDAAKTRLQLVQRDKVIQLIAFFENFSHGECMNFALKSTDVFETSGKGAKQTLRIVDAKFAMPKAKEAADASFVCLDMPEYPGEHDDITIVFGNESGMFSNCPTEVIKKVD